MKKLSYLTITFSLAMLTGCGGGGSGDSSLASQGNSANGNNELKCDRGILLNSNLTAKSIFDEHLYILNYLNIEDESSGHIEIKKLVYMVKKSKIMDKCYTQITHQFII